MYSPPIKYNDFLQKFPTEANAFQFYQKSCGIYCPSCGDKQFSYLRDDKPYMAYCKKCHKEFSILKDTILALHRVSALPNANRYDNRSPQHSSLTAGHAGNHLQITVSHQPQTGTLVR